MKKNVAILIFDNAEVLDFAGPFEVFSVASELKDSELFNVFTVARDSNAISAVNGLSVNPKYNFQDCPPVDILIISGGVGSRKAMVDQETLTWVEQIHHNTLYTVSICSGSRILGTLGLLDNKKYCTHQDVYEHMEEIVPSGLPQKEKRFVQEGKIFTSGGISAGIDLSFHIVTLLYSSNTAKETAAYMEYNFIQNVSE
ncbi:AraC family transcriptional regulator [Chryseobacterium sp. BLS98]|uniref:DJ-1/PfpI family protein n=1 Tax=Chryseobacterium sp. BLS98 TaxID=885586 RepID=UPI00065AC021|nr:DJ-1/PfpI family protein [Chryseobacterium sp. BLS98]KMQ61120.1 AraC family transcriptional regulator [Chryseobacterium sp. BLS98]